ncbi:MAG: hypothetical protein ABSH20_20450 [Tepidisphaeraceae bacterium]|jgi:hypothetical protein
MRVKAALLGAVVGVLGLAASADQVLLDRNHGNGSFENPAIPDAYPYVGTPDTWDMPGYFQGSFLNVTGIANVDGNQLAYILSSGQYGESFSQTLTGYTYEAGQQYTLSAGVCISAQSPLPTDRISLAFVYFDDQSVPHVVGNELDIYNDLSTGLSTTALKPFMLESGYISDPAIIGKEIGVRIWTTGTAVANPAADGGYFDLDNVQVTVPEPAALGFVTLAATALIRPRRRR